MLGRLRPGAAPGEARLSGTDKRTSHTGTTLASGPPDLTPLSAPAKVRAKQVPLGVKPLIVGAKDVVRLEAIDT